LSEPRNAVKRRTLLAGLYAIQKREERGAGGGNGLGRASHLAKICAAWRLHDGAQQRKILLGPAGGELHGARIERAVGDFHGVLM